MVKQILRTALVLLVCPTHLAAEPPAREEVQQVLLMTRRSHFDENTLGGLWQFHPESHHYQRLRPFLASTDGKPWGFDGGDGFLSAHGDVLTYRTWPSLIDFDVFSWRMIRRRPTSTTTEEEGWVVQGPTLAIEDAEPLGLAPGTYGIPRCVLHIVAGSLDFPVQCEPWAFPGVVDPNRYGTDAVVLWREPPPRDRATELFDTLEHYDWGRFGGAYPCLSFDPGRRGVWRCKPRGAVLYRIADGRIDDPVLELELGDPPFDIEDFEVERLFYLPAADTLYGGGRSYGGYHDDRFFFSVDPDNGESQLLGEWLGFNHMGAPDALAGLGQPPREHVQLLPVVATGPGAENTHWSTQLWFFNPSSEAMQVTVRRVSHPGQTEELALPAHGSQHVADAMTWLGGGPQGDGEAHDALVVSSSYRWGKQLVVVARVSTGGEGGTYGHAVPAVPGRVGYSNHIPYLSSEPPALFARTPGRAVAHLDLDLREGNRFRYNIGVVNDLDTPLTLTLIWGYHDWLEPEIGWARPDAAEVEVNVAAHDVEMFAVRQLFPAEVRERWAPRIAVLGDQAAAVWLSMIDNLTGDATFIPFTTFEYLNSSEEDRLVTPVVAFSQGVRDARWQTDLFGYTDRAAPLHAVFHPTRRESQCGGAIPPEGIEQEIFGEMGMPLSVWIQTLRQAGVEIYGEDRMASGFRTVFPNVIRLFDACSGEENAKGGLELSAGSWFSGFSRTYTTREDGGTYGGMLPLYPPGGWPVQHFAGIEVGDTFRVNVGFFNGDHDHAVAHRIMLYAADGSEVAERILTLQPLASFQRRLEHLFGVEVGTVPAGTYGMTVLPLDDPEQDVKGRSWAYVSLVDNVTGDPTNWW